MAREAGWFRLSPICTFVVRAFGSQTWGDVVTLSSGIGPGRVKLVVFQEIYPADVRKLKAQSADAKTGGGARDFRFPAAGFSTIFKTLFPDTKTVKRRRGGKRVDLKVNTGKVYWLEERDEELVLRSAKVDYEPPTSSRPSEDRLARVHEVPPLDPTNIPSPKEGPSLVLFIQDENDMVWTYYTSMKQLMKAGWEPLVAGPILKCLFHPDRKGMKSPPRVQGYVDLAAGRYYCHGF